MKRMSKKIKITNSWGIHYRVRYFLLEYIKKYNIKEFIIECTGLEETRNPKTYHDFKDVYANKEILLTIESDKRNLLIALINWVRMKKERLCVII